LESAFSSVEEPTPLEQEILENIAGAKEAIRCAENAFALEKQEGKEALARFAAAEALKRFSSSFCPVERFCGLYLEISDERRRQREQTVKEAYERQQSILAAPKGEEKVKEFIRMLEGEYEVFRFSTDQEEQELSALFQGGISYLRLALNASELSENGHAEAALIIAMHAEMHAESAHTLLEKIRSGEI
jgi:hypothetical protein